jgi:hypothetical protein
MTNENKIRISELVRQGWSYRKIAATFEYIPKHRQVLLFENERGERWCLQRMRSATVIFAKTKETEVLFGCLPNVLVGKASGREKAQSGI